MKSGAKLNSCLQSLFLLSSQAGQSVGYLYVVCGCKWYRGETLQDHQVELMNGCLAVAHSNLYIPSTLGGPVHTAKGTDENQLEKKP